MSTSLGKIMLLALVASPAAALSCYSYNDYDDKAHIIHHQKYCMAIYEVNDHQATFGGGTRHPSEVSNIRNMAPGKDCQLQNVVSNMGPPADMWLCFCFEDHCNYPFQWEEFEKRGFTLAQKVGPAQKKV